VEQPLACSQVWDWQRENGWYAAPFPFPATIRSKIAFSDSSAAILVGHQRLEPARSVASAHNYRSERIKEHHPMHGCARVTLSRAQAAFANRMQTNAP
jgi:hypothetical protein